MAMAPHQAVRQMVRNQVDYLPIDQGFLAVSRRRFSLFILQKSQPSFQERLDERAAPMLNYLKLFERAANLFPGFEAEIQGVYREIRSDGSVRFHTYVVRE